MSSSTLHFAGAGGAGAGSNTGNPTSLPTLSNAERLHIAALCYVDCSGSMSGRITAFNAMFERFGALLVDAGPDAPGPDRSCLTRVASSATVEIPLKHFGLATAASMLTDFLPSFPSKLGCGTRMWETVYNDVVAKHSLLNASAAAGAKKWGVVVYVLTDGEDNQSAGAFHGAVGAVHMANKLLAKGINVTLMLLPFGDDVPQAAIGAMVAACAATGGICHRIPDGAASSANAMQRLDEEFVKPISASIAKAKDSGGAEAWKAFKDGNSFNVSFTGDADTWAPQLAALALKDAKNKTHKTAVNEWKAAPPQMRDMMAMVHGGDAAKAEEAYIAMRQAALMVELGYPSNAAGA